MSHLTIHEGQVTWLPGLVLEDLPPDMPRQVSVQVKGRDIGLHADGVVGAFPLATGQTVVIRPKVGPANFLRMLFVAEGRQTQLSSELDRLVDYGLSDDESYVDLLVQRFITEVDRILRMSPRPDRLRVAARERTFVGNVNPVATALRVATRLDDPVSTVRAIRVTDTPENRVIALALREARRYMTGEVAGNLDRIQARWLRVAPLPSDAMKDIVQVKAQLARPHSAGSRGYYEEALAIALALLGVQGISPEGRTELRGEGHVLKTAVVFERYIRRTLQRLLSDKGVVVTGPEAASLSLYTNGSYELNPDVIFWRDSRPVLLIDAKYKEPDSGDHYQMSAYLDAFGLKRGVLVSPTEVSHRRVTFKKPNGVEVVQFPLPLVDLRESEDSLAELLLQVP